MAKGSSGGKRGGSAGGGGADDLESALKTELKTSEDLFGLANNQRTEGGDIKANELLDIAAKNNEKIVKELSDLKDIKRNKENSNKLDVQKKELLDKLEMVKKIRKKVEDYEKLNPPTDYTTLNPIFSTEKIAKNKFRILDKNAGISLKNDLVNPKQNGFVIGSIGYKPSGRGQVVLTHLPSGMSLGTHSKNFVTKDNLLSLHKISKKYGHKLGNNRDIAKEMANVILSNSPKLEIPR